MYRSELVTVAIMNKALNAGIVADPTEPQTDAKLTELDVVQAGHFDRRTVSVEVG